MTTAAVVLKVACWIIIVKLTFKSIAEDRVKARPGDSLPPRYRARMYDEIHVCNTCFEEYSRRDGERAKALSGPKHKHRRSLPQPIQSTPSFKGRFSEKIGPSQECTNRTV